MEPLLTTDEVADILRVKRTTVRALVRNGKLKAIEIAAGYRFRPHDVETYIAAHETRSTVQATASAGAQA